MGGIASVYYVPEYLSEAEEAQVAAQLEELQVLQGTHHL